MNETEKRQFLDHWAKTRRRGIVLYVLLTSLVWGTFAVVFLRLVMLLLEEGLTLETLVHTYQSRTFLYQWGIFLAGGILYATTLWFFYNWKYRRVKAELEKGKTDTA
ncbi:MAG: hypothetical protein EP344_00580 [Bacteroidetes bacterium]|nr:MAG: hypothetical protein EP344_00580 [Bacteroidota bacterium]